MAFGLVLLRLEVGLQHEVEDAAAAEVDLFDGVAHRTGRILQVQVKLLFYAMLK